MERWRIFPEHQRMNSEKHSTYGSNVSLCSVLMLQDNVCDGFLMSLDKDFSLLFRIKMLYYKLNVFYTRRTRNNSLGFYSSSFRVLFSLILLFSICSTIWQEKNNNDKSNSILIILLFIYLKSQHFFFSRFYFCFSKTWCFPERCSLFLYFIWFSDSPINNILSASSWTNVFSRHWYLNNCFDSSERLTSFMWSKPPKVFLFLKSSKNGSCLWTKNGDKRPFFFCLFVSLCRLIALSFQWETVVFVCTSNGIVLNGITHIKRNVFTLL